MVFYVRAQAQFCQYPGRTDDEGFHGGRRRALQPLCAGELSRCTGPFVAVQAFSGRRGGDRDRVYRQQHRYAGKIDDTGAGDYAGHSCRG